MSDASASMSASGPTSTFASASGSTSASTSEPAGTAFSARDVEADVTDRAAQARRWYRQRISAMVLALCVLVHLAVMIYAVRGGLSGAEILARTRGSLAFGAFYELFVIACAVHVPPGLNNIAVEWLRWRPAVALLVARLFGLVILVAGLRTVWAVVAT